MKFITKPNLPENRVIDVICSNNNELINSLNNLGINCKLINDYNFDYELSSHTDVKICHFSDKKFIVEKSLNVNLLNSQLVFTKENFLPKYPTDCLLNCTIIGRNAICNKKFIDSNLLHLLNDNNFNIINTKQGYSKCNICVINEHSFITSDLSIYNNTKDIFDVLLIDNGDIQLSHNHYGFIGGCSGKIDKDKVAFFGDLKLHKNFSEIKKFLFERDVEPISLIKGKPLMDVGSIIPITEDE